MLPSEISYNPATLRITAGPIIANSFTEPPINEGSGAHTINVMANTAFNGSATGTILLDSVGNLQVVSGNGVSVPASALASTGLNTATGTAVFTPPANFNGTISFTYTAKLQGDNNDQDKSTGTVTLVVTSVNTPPVVNVPVLRAYKRMRA